MSQKETKINNYEAHVGLYEYRFIIDYERQLRCSLPTTEANLTVPRFTFQESFLGHDRLFHFLALSFK